MLWTGNAAWRERCVRLAWSVDTDYKGRNSEDCGWIRGGASLIHLKRRCNLGGVPWTRMWSLSDFLCGTSIPGWSGSNTMCGPGSGYSYGPKIS